MASILLLSFKPFLVLLEYVGISKAFLSYDMVNEILVHMEMTKLGKLTGYFHLFRKSTFSLKTYLG